MALPPSTDFTGASITEGGFKTAITALRTFLATLLGTDESNKVAALTALGALMNSGLTKTGAYTIVANDKGKVIRCNGTFTLSITAAATLADGFAFAVLNEGSGTITIDPNGSELIDGATTKALAAGKLAIVYCNGSGFTTVGGFSMSDLLATDGAGSGLDADLLDGQQGAYYAPKDLGSCGIGMIAQFSWISGSCGAGATIAGSSLQWVGYVGSPPGTWRNITNYTFDSTYTSAVFQRVS